MLCCMPMAPKFYGAIWRYQAAINDVVRRYNISDNVITSLQGSRKMCTFFMGRFVLPNVLSSNGTIECGPIIITVWKCWAYGVLFLNAECYFYLPLRCHLANSLALNDRSRCFFQRHTEPLGCRLRHLQSSLQELATIELPVWKGIATFPANNRITETSLNYEARQT